MDGDQTALSARMQKEDLDGEHQKQFQQPDKNTQTNTQQKFPIQTQDMRQAQVQNSQCTQDYMTPQNPKPTQTQSFDVPDCYAEQIQLRVGGEKGIAQ